MLSRVGKAWRALIGKAEPPKESKQPQAKFDAARTGPENKNHWSAADSLGPRAALDPGVRQKLRDRSRYETFNNGYAGGLVEGRANDTIGTAPRLQLNLPESWTDPDFGVRQTTTPPDAARLVELKFLDWSEAIGLPDDLHVLDQTETRDGETFAVEITNPRLDPAGPQLDLKLFEAEECSTPNLDTLDPLATDGIRFDAAGNPVEYHFLRQHPGDGFGLGFTSAGFDYEAVPAERVYHLFTRKRPRQARGWTALAAALPLYAIMRRFTLAALGSAELAAMITAVITTQQRADGIEPEDIAAMDQVDFARNAFLTLAAGQDAKSFASSQPAPSYKEFKNEIHTECGATTGTPGFLSTGDYSQVNYSSGRLGRLPYQGGLKIRRDRWRRQFLDRLFRSWLREALLIPDYLPSGLPPVSLWRWGWRWDGFQSIDPVKDATANEIALRSGQTTLERVAAENGDDWEEILEQQAREMKARQRLGLPDPLAAKSPLSAPAAAEDTANA